MLMKDKYFFLSNFYPCNVNININGKELHFLNSEAAFQAQKNFELADKFCLLKPLEAKRYGKEIEITTENWNIYRLYAMAKVLNAKFRNYELMFQLKLVKGEIAEDNYWNDVFWGRCKGEGKNMLGKMLMNIRDNNNDPKALEKYITEQLIREVIV